MDVEAAEALDEAVGALDEEAHDVGVGEELERRGDSRERGDGVSASASSVRPAATRRRRRGTPRRGAPEQLHQVICLAFLPLPRRRPPAKNSPSSSSASASMSISQMDQLGLSILTTTGVSPAPARAGLLPAQKPLHGAMHAAGARRTLDDMTRHSRHSLSSQNSKLSLTHKCTLFLGLPFFRAAANAHQPEPPQVTTPPYSPQCDASSELHCRRCNGRKALEEEGAPSRAASPRSSPATSRRARRR
nr:uncharacterized protein LOC112936910 [Oryza sativa Japonica Group]